VRIDGHDFPEGLWYDGSEHLWLRPDGADGEGYLEVTVGVDAIGVEALGEVVYVQLLDPGQDVLRGQAVGSLEAEKMVRPLLAPLSGTIVRSNAALAQSPRLLNTDPYGRGWLLSIRAIAWDSEAADLLHEPAAVEAWARAEIAQRGEAP
jgi:glycine cleavage system H protein